VVADRDRRRSGRRRAAHRAEAPFIAQPDYTGPLVKILDGADISWIVGWIVAAGAYLILVRIGGSQPAPAAPGTAAASG
jgi:NCS1 family nucleobase:cation symporter-1